MLCYSNNFQHVKLSFPAALHVSNTWLVLLLVVVSRLHCESESFKMDLILDVNTQIYPVDLGTTFSHIGVRLHETKFVIQGGSLSCVVCFIIFYEW